MVGDGMQRLDIGDLKFDALDLDGSQGFRYGNGRKGPRIALSFPKRRGS